MATIALVSIAIASTGVVFFGLYRPWQLRWGATREEIDRTLPGDEVVSSPTFNSTRAVTIDATPAAIWPWIVQIGFGRAGWYSYDLLDNLGRHSAEHLVPDLQHMDVGDLVPLGPGKDSGMRVKDFETDRYMVWWDNRNRLTTWTWALNPLPAGGTRLVTRVRARSSWRHPSTMMWMPLLEVADFPMMRKCLLGIKRRAEALPRDPVLHESGESRRTHDRHT